MTSEVHSWLIDRYRASFEEVPTSDVDRVILAAARRQSMVRRFARRTRIAFVVTAAAAMMICLTWRSHQLNAAQARVSDYGKVEGAARSYLLSATTPPFSGAGVAEGLP
jgi:hypothetical protein